MKTKGIISQYFGLPKSIYVLFFASIINNLGQFVGPFLTMFLTFKQGMSVNNVGIIVAINAIFGLLGSLLSGKLIDTIGRKKVFVFFSLVSATFYGLCGFSINQNYIVLLLLFGAFFGGFSHPVFSTIITDLTSGNERKLSFSLNYMALNIGFSLGPLLAGFLYENYLVWLFFGDALTTYISVLLVFLYVPETKELVKKVAKNKEIKEKKEDNLLKELLKNPNLIKFSLIIIIYFIVFSQFNFGLPLQVKEVFNSNASKVFGILMTTNAVICSIFTVFVTSFTKKLKSSQCIFIGGILYGLGFGIIYFINTLPMFIVSTFIWTMGEILVSTNTNIYIAEHSPKTHRGRFNSIFPIIRKIGFVIGPIFAGFYINNVNSRSLWVFISALSFLGSILMYRLYKGDTNNI